MARLTSTPTTLTVTNLPAWLPPKGSWSGTLASGQAVSLNTAESIKGDFPPAFPASRNLGALFEDFSGAVWSPHIGINGAMLFHGGGHSATTTYSPMLDNAVYMWRADTRLWSRLTDPTYPGSVPGFGPFDWGWSRPRTTDNLLEADEPLRTYGELRENVPCSNHSRYNLTVLPPARGGGSSGSLVLARVTSAHITGAGQSNWGHKLDCAAALGLGSANAYQAWERFAVGPNPHLTDSITSASSCIDTARGYLYQTANSAAPLITRYKFGSAGYESCTPSNWGSTYFRLFHSGRAQMVYVPILDCIVWLNADYEIAVSVANGSPNNLTAVVTPPVTGTANRPAATAAEKFGATWCPDLGNNGALVCWDYRTNLVHACYAPSNPLAGAWTWALLTANNRPNPGNATWWYARFQYAPALKSFFLCSMPNDAYGGILCFRPSEIS